jgi:hypothetical protein
LRSPPAAAHRRALAFEARGREAEKFSAAQALAPISTVPIALRIAFSIDRHCSCAGAFSLARATFCIVIGVPFPLQIDCILLGSPGA